MCERIKEQIEKLSKVRFAGQHKAVPGMCRDAAKSLSALLEVYEAAKMLQAHMPLEHVPGLIQRSYVEGLYLMLAYVESDSE